MQLMAKYRSPGRKISRNQAFLAFVCEETGHVALAQEELPVTLWSKTGQSSEKCHTSSKFKLSMKTCRVTCRWQPCCIYGHSQSLYTHSHTPTHTEKYTRPCVTNLFLATNCTRVCGTLNGQNMVVFVVCVCLLPIVS